MPNTNGNIVSSFLWLSAKRPVRDRLDVIQIEGNAAVSDPERFMRISPLLTRTAPEISRRIHDGLTLEQARDLWLANEIALQVLEAHRRVQGEDHPTIEEHYTVAWGNHERLLKIMEAREERGSHRRIEQRRRLNDKRDIDIGVSRPRQNFIAGNDGR